MPTPNNNPFITPPNLYPLAPCSRLKHGALNIVPLPSSSFSPFWSPYLRQGTCPIRWHQLTSLQFFFRPNLTPTGKTHLDVSPNKPRQVNQVTPGTASPTTNPPPFSTSRFCSVPIPKMEPNPNPQSQSSQTQIPHKTILIPLVTIIYLAAAGKLTDHLLQLSQTQPISRHQHHHQTQTQPLSLSLPRSNQRHPQKIPSLLQ